MESTINCLPKQKALGPDGFTCDSTKHLMGEIYQFSTKWYSHFERHLPVCYKIKHTLTIRSSNWASWYLSKGTANLCPPKNLHRDVFRTFIHNCQNLEAANMSFSRWMDKKLCFLCCENIFSIILFTMYWIYCCYF